MTQRDVRHLAENQTLKEAPFPASPRAEFRVHLSPAVHDGIAEHAKRDTSVEICGVLVGDWKQDPNGPYAVVSDYIRCESATSRTAEVTFTHESWAQINQEMDSRFAESRIVGWYHSHPDFGVFLSDRDRFIQEHFFDGSGQIAYVVDPVRQQEGVFVWRDDRPELLPHYWVGDRLVARPAERKSQAAGSAASTSRSRSAATVAAGRPLAASLDVTRILAWLCLFLLGYLLASTTSRWERERLVQGTVAHYGVNRLMRVGLEPRLQELQQHVAEIGSDVAAFESLDPSAWDENQSQEFAERVESLQTSLSKVQEELGLLEQDYGYTELERSALALFVAQKQAELNGLMKPAKTAVDEKDSQPKTAKDTADDASEKTESEEPK